MSDKQKTADTERLEALDALKRLSQGVHELHAKGIKCQEADDYGLILSHFHQPTARVWTLEQVIDICRDEWARKHYLSQVDVIEDMVKHLAAKGIIRVKS